MRVPLEWLKEYVEVEATVEEIAERLTMSGLEVEAVNESELGPRIDIYVTPNRGDCLSMVGVAREVAALFDAPLKSPLSPPSSEGGETAQQTSVTIEAPDLCPRYAARLIRGVKIGPSPEWMQKRLKAADSDDKDNQKFRPINNVVDVTNYVLLELGQPLHAFDFDQLSGGRIVVRRAAEGETIATLDGKARALTTETLVIADAEKAVAVAGVMGGADSEVSDSTVNILLESAHFHPLAVRRASRALNLKTEASYRFERVVDPNGVRRAVDRACELLEEMGQPAAVEGVTDVYPEVIERKVVNLRVGRAAALLGIPDITSHVAADCLRRLGFDVRTEPNGETDTLVVHVPTYRADVSLEEDLIEEVGRIYGYENIPETLPVGGTTQGGDSEEGRFIRKVREILVGCGLQEVVTHSLTAPSFFEAPEDAARVLVRNALSADVGGLRFSLLPTLLEVAQRNASREQRAVAIFEVGRVWEKRNGQMSERVNVGGLLTGPATEGFWSKDSEPAAADFWAARGVVDRLLDGLGVSGATARGVRDEGGHFHPGRCAMIHDADGRPLGILGELHPKRADEIGLRDRVYLFEMRLIGLENAALRESFGFRVVSRFPVVSRDLAPRVDALRPYGEVAAAVREAKVDLLEELRLTDVFSGSPLPEGTKSFTLSLTFRAPDRTLSEAETSDALARIRASLEERCGASFPS